MGEAFSSLIKDFYKGLSTKGKGTIGISLAAGATFVYITKVYLQYESKANG